MNRLYEKSRLGFALAWIGIYVLGLSLADSLSASIGLEKIVTAPLSIVLSIALWRWVRKRGLGGYYGLQPFCGSLRGYGYFLPLALICSVNLWFGFARNASAAETALYIISMLGVGFLEEVIFRGLLYRALEGDGVGRAIWIAGVTFGLGHIVNLLNGAEFLPTLLQLVYASAIGVLFVVIFYKSGSLLPCIIAHCVVNSLSIFAAPRPAGTEILVSLALAAVTGVYALYVWKKCPQEAQA